MPHVYNGQDLKWNGLKLKGRGRVLAEVVPDNDWPKMYRVRYRGELSDMVNLTRAKDAAISFALYELNGRQTSRGKAAA